MAHSNSTTNYSLPQFVSADKPAWLTDVNTAYADIDTGMHNAQVAADNAQTDATQALTTAGEASTAAAAADAKASGSIASIASAFDTTSTYNVDDVVIYNNLLYICSLAVVNPGPWTGSANWNRTTIDDLIIRDIIASDVSYSNTSSGLTSTNVQAAIDEVKGDIDDVENNLPKIIELNASASTNLTANNIVTVDFTFNVPTGYRIINIVNNTLSSNFLMNAIRVEDGDGTRTVRVNVWSNTTYANIGLNIRAICANNVIR